MNGASKPKSNLSNPIPSEPSTPRAPVPAQNGSSYAHINPTAFNPDATPIAKKSGVVFAEGTATTSNGGGAGHNRGRSIGTTLEFIGGGESFSIAHPPSLQALNAAVEAGEKEREKFGGGGHSRKPSVSHKREASTSKVPEAEGSGHGGGKFEYLEYFVFLFFCCVCVCLCFF